MKGPLQIPQLIQQPTYVHSDSQGHKNRTGFRGFAPEICHTRTKLIIYHLKYNTYLKKAFPAFMDKFPGDAHHPSESYFSS